MTDTNIANRIRSCTTAFLGDLGLLIQEAARIQVERALAQSMRPLASNGSQARSRSSSQSHPPKQARIRRSQRQLDELGGTLMSFIKSHPGARMEQISVGLGMPSKALSFPLKQLVRNSRLRTEGNKRATSYFPKARAR